MEFLKRILANQSGTFEEETLKNFSILIPIVKLTEGQYGILFEKRAKGIRQPSEICFPGGHIEDGETPWEAALRETYEEIGIDPVSIIYIGKMKKLIPHTRLIIHPFVAEIPVSSSFSLNEEEVEEVFIVPIDDLLEIKPTQYQARLKVFPEEGFPYHLIPNGRNYRWREGKTTQYFYQYKDKVIWGLTANILLHFLDCYRKGKASSVLQ